MSPGYNSDMSSIEAGQLVDNRYLIIRELGAGGAGAVYTARDVDLDREVALKFLLESHWNRVDKEVLKRFQREAKALSKIHHENIVSIFGYAMWNDRPYIVMEVLAGKSLRAYLLEGGPINLTDALQICWQVCNALETAHKASVVHRDVKPDNIIVSGNTGSIKAKLIDFGLCSIAENQIRKSGKVTNTGALIGTINYMSPEAVLGQPLTDSSDVYSLGCTFFEMLTGEPPFQGESPLEVIEKHVKQAHPGLGGDSKFITELNEILEHTLCKAASKRISIQQLRLRIEHLLASDSDPDARFVRSLTRSPSKRVFEKSLYLAVIPLLVVVIGAIWMLTGATSNQRQTPQLHSTTTHSKTTLFAKLQKDAAILRSSKDTHARYIAARDIMFACYGYVNFLTEFPFSRDEKKYFVDLFTESTNFLVNHTTTPEEWREFSKRSYTFQHRIQGAGLEEEQFAFAHRNFRVKTLSTALTLSPEATQLRGGGWAEVCILLCGTANFKANKGLLSDAERDFNQAIEISVERKMPESFLDCSARLGVFWLEQGRLQEAIQLLKSLEKNGTECENTKSLLSFAKFKTMTDFSLEKYRDVVEFLNSSSGRNLFDRLYDNYHLSHDVRPLPDHAVVVRLKATSLLRTGHKQAALAQLVPLWQLVNSLSGDDAKYARAPALEIFPVACEAQDSKLATEIERRWKVSHEGRALLAFYFPDYKAANHTEESSNARTESGENLWIAAYSYLISARESSRPNFQLLKRFIDGYNKRPSYGFRKDIDPLILRKVAAVSHSAPAPLKEGLAEILKQRRISLSPQKTCD